MKRLLAAPLFFTAATLFAQRRSPTPYPTSTPVDSAAVAAAAAGIFGVWGACCVFEVLFIGACLAGWIVAALWVMNDAKSRNSENAQLVTVLTWIPPTWWLGLVIHLVTRPKGNLVPCPHCQKKRLEGLAVCPHCGQP
jgi:hypothetical protein